MTATTSQTLNSHLPAEPVDGLRSASYFGLVLAQVLGIFNDNLLRWLAVPLAAPHVGEVSAVALGGLCLTLPFLLFMPVAGWMADRFCKRRVIAICKMAELILMTASILVILYGQLWMLFLLVFLLGTQAALFGPAKFGSLPEMLPVRHLSKANGILGMGTIVAVGLGTISGFLLYAQTEPVMGAGNWSTVWPIALVLLSISIMGVISSLAIRTAPAAAPDRPLTWNPITDILPALKVIRDDRRLLRTTAGIAFFLFLASLAQQNISPFVSGVLQLDAGSIGMFLGVMIAGVGVGSLLAGYWSDGKVELGMIPVGAAGVVVTATGAWLSGWLMNPALPAEGQFAYWGALTCLFLLGFSGGIFSVPLEAYLQYRSDPRQRGMVLAGSFFVSYVFVVFSFGLFYLLGQTLQLSPSLIFLVLALLTVPVLVYTVWLLPDWTFRFLLRMVTRTFFRIQIKGREHIPIQGPAVLVANHVSFLDGVIMCIICPRFVRFVIYTDFTQLPGLAFLARLMRAIPIRATDGPTSIVRSIQTARSALKDGDIVCIFAEGGLTRTGQLQPFQRGLLKITQGFEDIPVIPAYLHGLWGSIFSWRDGKVFWKWPRSFFSPISLHIGPPLHGLKDVAVARQAVERLGAEAAMMSATSEDLIPVRLFIRRCKANRQAVKVSDSTNVSLTGGRLLTGALAFRNLLRRKVLSSREKQVGLLLPPSVGGCLANLALALDRRAAVNLNYTLTEDVLNYCVKKAGLKHVLTSRKFLEKKPFELQGAEFVFLEDLKKDISTGDKVRALLGARLLPAWLLDRLLGLNRISPDDTLSIIFTSGSTGEPKGVVLSHANVGSNVNAVDQLLNLTTEDALLGVLPFFHSFGYTASMWLPMCYQVRGIYHFNPLDAKVVGRLCQENKATIMMATPTFLKMYLRRCEPEQFSSLDLIVVGAEKLPVDLAKHFEEKFGILPTEGYGTTELSPVAAVNVPDHRSRDVEQPGTRLGTVGRPLPGVTAKVVDPETFEDRGIGTEGLLLIKGPNVMRGYLDAPEKTSEVIHDGWYNTGDFASIDKDGFVTITGRQSRFSKIGGEMVPHIRIEQELLTICESDDQDDALIPLVVTAVPDECRGERIIVLYTRLGKPTEQVLRELAATGLPKLWLPSADSFIQVESIPILGTGKLDLRGVKDLALHACCESVT